MIAKARRFMVYLSSGKGTPNAPRQQVCYCHVRWAMSRTASINRSTSSSLRVARATDAHQSFRLQAETIYDCLCIEIPVRNEQTISARRRATSVEATPLMMNETVGVRSTPAVVHRDERRQFAPANPRESGLAANCEREDRRTPSRKQFPTIQR